MLAGCDSTSSTPAPLAADKAPGAPWQRTESREPCAGFDLLRRPFFGDLHVHTRFSADAYIYGTKVGPSDAYAFARGEALALSDDDEQPTRRARIDRPLDFAAVTDHAEFFGEVNLCTSEDSGVHDIQMCRDLRANDDPNDRFAVIVEWLFPAGIPDPPKSHGFCAQPGIDCDAAAVSVWREIQAAAEEAYDRSDACTFTSFVGYEHTASLVGRHQHRNVIFRNEHVPDFASSQLETAQDGIPQGLWNAVERDCLDAGRGCDAVVIPHNPNLSGGKQFEDPIDAWDALRRQDREPLVEIHQIKSSSECRFDRVAGIGVGTEDERCGFEQRPNAHEGPDEPPPVTAKYPPRNLVRNALKEGLALEDKLGVNPFHMGFVGSTDNHDAAAGSTAESEWPGGQGNSDSSPARRILNQIRDNPGGLAVVWAEENSRDAIFSALRRRETYATSGTRPTLRFFAGEIDGVDCGVPDLLRRSYERGVPMGGEIGTGRAGASPRFVVLAQKDPGTPEAPGADLERAQIVKGWVDRAGVTHERVFDVAKSPTADSVRIDPATCSADAPGSSELCTTWEDPEFDPALRAFYYVRLVENPTCRWSTLVCREQGIDPLSSSCAAEAARAGAAWTDCCLDSSGDAFAAAVVRERAWGSPVWYRPDAIASVGGAIDVGHGSLALDLAFGRLPGALVSREASLRLRVTDDEDVVSIDVPPEAWSEEPAGGGTRIWGARAGAYDVRIARESDGSGSLRIEASGVDVSGVDPVDHAVRVSVESGLFRSAHERLWRFSGRRLEPVAP